MALAWMLVRVEKWAALRPARVGAERGRVVKVVGGRFGSSPLMASSSFSAVRLSCLRLGGRAALLGLVGRVRPVCSGFMVGVIEA